jgi:hypothetical protein
MLLIAYILCGKDLLNYCYEGDVREFINYRMKMKPELKELRVEERLKF